ncbi:MAG: SGNH/GDSL hydrolase family protein [Pseudoxanthomonas sp.]
MNIRRLIHAAALASTLLAGACASRPAAEAAPPAAPAAAATAVAPEVASGRVSSPEWAQDMARFAEQDAAHPPPRGAVLFIGSSSIRFWASLAQDFPATPVINRGFGGSQVRDSTYYADRIVVPYAPSRIVFYAGDNDLAAGRSPQQVADDFVAFVRRVRRDLPQVPIAYIAIKASPSRLQLQPQMAQANALVRAAAAGLPAVGFIDVYTPMLDARGKPRPELFREDMLHMNAAGYAIWKEKVGAWLAATAPANAAH